MGKYAPGKMEVIFGGNGGEKDATGKEGGKTQTVRFKR